MAIYGLIGRSLLHSFSKSYFQQKFFRFNQDLGQHKYLNFEIDTIQEEIDEFASCIATNVKPEVGGREALVNIAVIEAAVLSNLRGRPVDIAELIG